VRGAKSRFLLLSDQILVDRFDNDGFYVGRRNAGDRPDGCRLRHAFFAKQTLTPLQIKHLGWIRIFHGYTKGFRWNKGGRLYSQPQGRPCYQNLPETKTDARQLTRSQMRINGERLVEIDISSSYLTIFYSLCDQQLDPAQDACAGILGTTALDRQVAKFWINASLK
jgi:hypothetical protein